MTISRRGENRHGTRLYDKGETSKLDYRNPTSVQNLVLLLYLFLSLNVNVINNYSGFQFYGPCELQCPC